MANSGKLPGSNTGNNGGIFREVGPRGGLKSNYAAVPDNKQLPPTQTPGSTWKQVKRTPDSYRK
uniref:Uncharacterized protein n=1 Tax=Polaromonas sp. E19S TaxID=1840257 RepID=A0A2S1FHS3_9BURK|nr:hypothetical protein [Polaromonas sp. E19S]AWD72023.1 hypothetical protein pE19SP1_p006 [Polaromonas sp. E19S]